MSPRSRRLGALLAVLALAVPAAAPADAARARRHHHRRAVPEPVEEVVVAPPPRDPVPYQSGVAFGLLGLGISATPTAISPYAQYDYGYVRPGDYGPGYSYPGY